MVLYQFNDNVLNQILLSLNQDNHRIKLDISMFYADKTWIKLCWFDFFSKCWKPLVDRSDISSLFQDLAMETKLDKASLF